MKTSTDAAKRQFLKKICGRVAVAAGISCASLIPVSFAVHPASASGNGTVAVTGRILDSSGMPMADWSIQVTSSDNTVSSSLQTDSQGNFSGNVPSGADSVSITGAPLVYHNGLQNFAGTPQSFTWDPSSSSDVLNMTVPALQTYTLNASDGGSPVAGAVAQECSSWVYSTPFDIIPGVSETLQESIGGMGDPSDSSGNISLTAFPVDNVNLCVSYSLNGLTQTVNQTANLDSPSTPIDFAFTVSGVQISGHLRDSSGTPMSGWNFQVASPDGSEVVQLTTDAQGSFSGFVPTGADSVTITGAQLVYHNGLQNFAGTPQSFTWDPSSSSDVLNMTVPALQTYTLHATNNGVPVAGAVAQECSNWVYSTPFDIIPGVSETLQESIGGMGDPSDSSGNISLTAFPVDNVNLCVSYSLNGLAQTLNEVTNLGVSSTPINFPLNVTGVQVSGNLVDTSGVAMSGWNLQIASADGSEVVQLTTDNQGNFSGFVPTGADSVTITGGPLVYHNGLQNFAGTPQSFTWDPSSSSDVLDMTVPALTSYTVNVTNNGVPVEGADLQECSGWVYSAPFNIIPGVSETLQESIGGESDLTDANGNTTVAAFPATSVNFCASISGAGVTGSSSIPSVDLTSLQSAIPITFNLSLPQIPTGVSVADLAAPTTVVVATGSPVTAVAATSAATANLASAAGSLPSGTTLNLFPLVDQSSYVNLLPSGQTLVAGFAIDWAATDGSSPSSTAPISLVITSSSIHAGDIAYKVVNGQVVALGTATVDGSVTVTFTDDPVFLVAQVPPTYTVPDLSGDTVSQAESAITTAGFTVGTETPITAGATAQNNGQVVAGSQNPTAQTVENSTSVSIDFSYYNYVAPTYTVPDLSGDTVHQAESAITTAGFTVGTETPITAGATAQNNGQVVAGSQNPTAQTVENSTSVSIDFSYYNYVASVPSSSVVTVVTRTMPNVVGLSVTDAQSALVAAGITVSPTETAVTAGATASNNGQVISQSLAAGTSVSASGASLGLSYYSYVAPPVVTYTVPNLIGLTVAQAVSALSEAGFTVAPSEIAMTAGATASNNGLVLSQTVATGAAESSASTAVGFSYYHYVAPHVPAGQTVVCAFAAGSPALSKTCTLALQRLVTNAVSRASTEITLSTLFGKGLANENARAVATLETFIRGALHAKHDGTVHIAVHETAPTSLKVVKATVSD